MNIVTLIQLFLILVFHHVPDTYNMQLGLNIHQNPTSEQILHAISNHHDFSLLVRTLNFPKNKFLIVRTQRKIIIFAVQTNTRFTVVCCFQILFCLFVLLLYVPSQQLCHGGTSVNHTTLSPWQA